MGQILDQAKLAAFCAEAVRFQEGLEQACQVGWINTPVRIRMFLAQCAHESAGFKHTVENLNYSADALRALFPRHFADGQEFLYARQPEKIANRLYADRMGNGDESSGDGWRYRGRGLIQVTGKTGYQRYATVIGEDVIVSPELLEQPLQAAISAGLFWSDKKLNALADAQDLAGATRIINGGLNGIDDRRAWYLKAQQVWAVNA